MKKVIKKLTPARQTTAIYLTATLLLAVACTVVILHYRAAKHSRSASSTVSHAGSEHRGSSITPSSTAASPPPSTSDADKQAAAHAAARPMTDACKLLTQEVATRLLGASAKTITPSNTSAMQATDTTITVCAYVGNGNDVQLVIRKPAGSLGASENALVFGSGKPTSVVKVSGYGQTAYWDSGKHALNILGDNNWYIITRGSNGTQADTEAAARLLASGF